MANELARHDVLAEGKRQPYFLNTLQIVASERQSGVTIYSPQKDAFDASRFTELGDVKVAVLGQNPYHGPGQARGLTFSVHSGIATPPSLLNIHKELESTIPGFTYPNHGYLESWACQGVLPLNTVLMVRAGQVHSYVNLGWGTFTDKVTDLINQHREGVMSSLWGSHTQKKGAIIDKQRHHVLKVPHPPLLLAHRGFFDYNHFVLANQWLEQCGKTPIDWTPVLPAENE